MKPIVCRGVGLAQLLVAAGVPASAQNQAPSSSQTSPSGSSLGAYARQIRKEPGAAKSTPKVFDNDNLPKQDKLSIVGQKAAPASDNSKLAQSENTTPAAGAATTPTPTDGTTGTQAQAGASANAAAGQKASSTGAAKAPEDEATKQAAMKQWADKIATQKAQIDLLGRELDVLQREYQIRAAAMYADVGNRLRNSGDWDKQDAQYKQQIADKQKAVDDAKQKLDDMQEEARKAGMPASVSEP
jgi:hypothetical protein